jgi:radical SAM protein with 4Fe4S-binding SPASM domain
MSYQQLRFASKFNFIWKMIAHELVVRCKSCGYTRLESVFHAYITNDKPSCRGCQIASHLVRPLIKHVFSETTLDEQRIKQLIHDKLVRRSMINVVRGISHFGIKIPQPTAAPVVIVWNYTNRCNLNCIHCHQNSGVGDNRELSTQEAMNVIDNISEAGVSVLTFSGGEPLVRSDIFTVIERATDAGLLCTIASNGTLITKHTAQQLRKSGVRRVEIGLDGCNAETHDFLRNAPGAFEATIQGITNCVKAGFDEVCTTMTLHERNIDELQSTVELAEALGVTRFYLNRLIPAGRGRNVINLDVTNKQKVDALKQIYSKFHKSVVTGEGIQCYARGMTYYSRLGYEQSHGTIFTVSEALSGYSQMWQNKLGDGIARLVQKYYAGFGGCSAGITYAGLTAEGDLLPCVPAPILLGNLLTDDLETLWVTNPLLNHIRQRDNLTGSCGRCAYNILCGGCRYTAYALKGNWLAADPSCPFGPAS